MLRPFPIRPAAEEILLLETSSEKLELYVPGTRETATSAPDGCRLPPQDVVAARLYSKLSLSSTRTRPLQCH